ncbi:MAG: ABC transporter substrate-binding protein, partial [Planctomycetota bacterium]
IVAKGPFHPAGTQSDKDLSDLAYDRAEAARQLAAAGYTDTDGDGIVDRNGDPLSVRIIYPAGSDDYRKTITFVRDCLARGGVRVELQQMEFSLMIDAIESRKFEAISLGWTSGVEVNIRQMFHSDQIPAGGDNFMSYSNPALDALLDKAVREPDPALRTTLWRKCERIVVETQPYTFLARRQSLVVVHNRFANVRLRPSGTLNYDGYAVYVPLDRQRGR